MPIIGKIARGDCSGCDRENCYYFGVAFKCFPTSKRVVFDEDGFISCSKADRNKGKWD